MSWHTQRILLRRLQTVRHGPKTAPVSTFLPLGLHRRVDHAGAKAVREAGANFKLLGPSKPRRDAGTDLDDMPVVSEEVTRGFEGWYIWSRAGTRAGQTW